jgi:hypothetical protein
VLGSRERLLALGIISIVVAITVGFLVIRSFRRGPYCEAKIGNQRYELTVAQAANAKTIAAIGLRDGFPHHAVTVALAAALQESQLHNLAGGDRDSVGLFQQRPSQGWGTPAQLRDPRFAAAAFYRALGRVSGWSRMPVTAAAQSVQRSATPGAYANWEAEARVLARILTREVPETIACHPRSALL